MNWDRVRRVFVVTVALLAAAPAAAQAVTVTNTNDSGPSSLRAALAQSGVTTIDFSPALNGQTITLTSGALQVTHGVTIEGPGAGELTIDGNNAGRVFEVQAPSTDDVTISGLTITRGSFTATTSPHGGGGVLFNGGHSLTLDGDAITGNHVSVASAGSAGGGGVYSDSNSLIVTGTTISDNDVTITGGTGSDGGGGLYSNSSDVTITNSAIDSNAVTQTGTTGSGSDGGGGIYANSGSVEVTSGTVEANSDTVDLSTSGSDGGGAIYSNSADVTLGDATVDSNSFTLSDSQAGNNGGGGLYSNSGHVGVLVSSLDANSATVKDSSGNGADGGGGLFSDAGQITVDESSISENSASVNAAGGGGDNGGGAIFDEASGIQQFYLTSTFSGNSITISGSGASSGGNGGGAIRTFGGGDASNMTIAGNHADGLGGGVSSDGVFALKNTIIADNTATIASANCAGSFSSSGFNLENLNTCGLNATGDLVNTEPKLGPLQNNGGPTLTRALLAGSPAIDAGSCTSIVGSPLTTDQRGVATPQPAGGKCDIGAYEAAGGSGGSGSPPPSAPATVPGTPAATSSTGAAFTGSVNPNGQATTVSFQYGIDSRYRPGGGSAVIYDQSTPPQTLPADSAAHAVTASATGLVPNALYHVRLVASNASGTTFGPDQTFTTPAGAAPPPPVLGQTVNVKPVSGQVFILVAGKLVPLTEAQKIPSGAILDTRTGSLQLTAALGKGKQNETGVFGGAIFKLTQDHNGLTNLSLAEGAFSGAPSYATCKAHKAGEASAAATKTLQLLHASAKGKFRTTGRYSAATVRGTKWTIADRCDGTLTRDLVHSVAVTDFVRHKTIVLHAGQSYLARAHKPKK